MLARYLLSSRVRPSVRHKPALNQNGQKKQRHTIAQGSNNEIPMGSPLTGAQMELDG